MLCEYNDKFRVDYSGSLHISKGDGFEITVKGDQIPTNVKLSLDSAVRHNSCSELRTASRALTNTINQLWDIK
jgi:hypothetical protein